MNRDQVLSRSIRRAIAITGLAAVAGTVSAGAYVSASGFGVDRITHPSGYDGTGGPLVVEVCISPTSEAQTEMLVSLENSIFRWNQLNSVSPNLFLGGSNDIPGGRIDFESTLVHEIGHCIGLAHPNAATESGLPNADRNYTKADEGTNGVYDLDPGTDGIKGSADDIRGDDVSLHWTNPDNNPFVLFEPVDSTNYSVFPTLPAGDTFPANADRDVGAALGFPNTEAVMQQGAFFDEDQRQLAVDDVMMIRFGQSGLDETEGTADDYQLQLVYGGVQSGCDITVQVTGSSFAFCSVPTQTISGNHRRVAAGAFVQMESLATRDWYFNQTRVGPEEIFADGFES